MTASRSLASNPERLALPPPLSIRTVDAIRELILVSLKDHREVVVEIDDETDADLSIVQLLEAARLHAAENGTAFTLSTPVNARIAETLRRAGFLSAMDASSSLFWFHRKDAQ